MPPIYCTVDGLFLTVSVQFWSNLAKHLQSIRLIPNVVQRNLSQKNEDVENITHLYLGPDDSNTMVGSCIICDNVHKNRVFQITFYCLVAYLLCAKNFTSLTLLNKFDTHTHKNFTCKKWILYFVSDYVKGEGIFKSFFPLSASQYSN